MPGGFRIMKVFLAASQQGKVPSKSRISWDYPPCDAFSPSFVTSCSLLSFWLWKERWNRKKECVGGGGGGGGAAWWSTGPPWPRSTANIYFSILSPSSFHECSFTQSGTIFYQSFSPLLFFILSFRMLTRSFSGLAFL